MKPTRVGKVKGENVRYKHPLYMLCFSSFCSPMMKRGSSDNTHAANGRKGCIVRILLLLLVAFLVEEGKGSSLIPPAPLVAVVVVAEVTAWTDS